MGKSTLLDAWNRLQARTLSVSQARAIDELAIRMYGMHSLVLMENAALGCVEWLCRRFPAPQATTILCGRGNNGGDGLAIARHLTNHGWPCAVFLLGPLDGLSTDAQANYQILTTGGGMEVQVVEGPPSDAMRHCLRTSTVILDALLGTGARGAPRAPLDEWLEVANRSSAFRVAIDTPTGVDASSGDVEGSSFQAQATLTFVTRKPAMASTDPASRFGEIVVLPIGLPAQMMREVLSQLDVGNRA